MTHTSAVDPTPDVGHLMLGKCRLHSLRIDIKMIGH